MQNEIPAILDKDNILAGIKRMREDLLACKQEIASLSADRDNFRDKYQAATGELESLRRDLTAQIEVRKIQEKKALELEKVLEDIRIKIEPEHIPGINFEKFFEKAKTEAARWILNDESHLVASA
ncbi:MAG: hypothetical protein HQM10_25595 [Candidatus Riflebacteria bacterium]|nr:hypothetical protein [Candidatus Riflebacteria bacterium]